MKKKLKFIYRILGVMLTFVVVFNFFIGGVQPWDFTYYDTVEELKAEFPNYYYFDFDLENKELTNCCAIYKVISSCAGHKKGSYYGYDISYSYECDYFNETLFYMGCDATKDLDYWINLMVSEYRYTLAASFIIDNINCTLIYRKEYWHEYSYSMEIYFKLDNVTYTVSLFGKSNIDINLENEVLDYFISIANPVIRSHHNLRGKHFTVS